MDIKNQAILNEEQYFEIQNEKVRARLLSTEQRVFKFSRNEQLLHLISNNSTCKLDFHLQEISQSMNLTVGMWVFWYSHCINFFKIANNYFDFDGLPKRTDIKTRSLLKNYEVDHINLRRKLKKYQVCHYEKLNDSPDTNVYSNTIFMLQNSRGSVS